MSSANPTPQSAPTRTSLGSPLRFRMLPGVLRVRIARKHPGASPSAIAPDGATDTVRALLGIAAGRERLPRAL